jgi:hypothetical protein
MASTKGPRQEARGPLEVVLISVRPRGASAGIPRCHPRLQRPKAGRRGPGRSRSSCERTAHHVMDHAWEMVERPCAV